MGIEIAPDSRNIAVRHTCIGWIGWLGGLLERGRAGTAYRLVGGCGAAGLGKENWLEPTDRPSRSGFSWRKNGG